MQICKDEKSYKCSNIKTHTVDGVFAISFSIIEYVSPKDIAELFDNNSFYFYDDVFDSRMVETNGKKLVGLSIKYNADSTYDITINLI